MTTLADRQKEFCSAFMPAYPMRSAAAIGGNATQESLCRPVTGQVDHGSDAALQWRVERLTGPDGLKPWCEAQGIPWDTLHSQALFTMHELDHPQYAALKADLKAGAKSLETLTANFVDTYERPSAAGRELDKRIAYAHDCLAVLMRDAPAPGPIPVPMPPIPQIESLQMPIELILQIIAPIALNFASGLLKGALAHVQANGVSPSPLHPSGLPVTAPVAPTAPVIDLVALEPLIARLIAAEIAKIGKPSS